MTNWQADKKWSDKFIPEIKQILGLHLIGEPPIEEDQQRNTDLVVLKMEAVRIGCRMRKHEYHKTYPNDITIRAGRPSGMKTELTKIIEGWGDYFFYGFEGEDGISILAWTLGDLNVFRLWFNREIIRLKGNVPGNLKENKDKSSSFLTFQKNNLPTDFIIGEKP